MRPRIWIPELKSNIPTSYESIPTMGIVMSGYFHVELKNPKTQEVKFSGSFPNVITNRFMDFLGGASGSFSTLFSALAVGSGTTAPSGTDTKLDGEFGSRSTNNAGIVDTVDFISGSGLFGCYWSFKRTRLFDAGINTGSITEFGWFTGPSSTNMMNRSLIRDSAGIPTSISKSVDDELRVIYEYRAVVPTISQSFSIDVRGSTIDVKILPINIAQGYGYTTPGWGYGVYDGLSTRLGGNGSVLCQLLAAQVYTGSNPTPFGPNTSSGYFTGSIIADGPRYSTAGAASAYPETSSMVPYITGTYYVQFDHVVRASNVAVNSFPTGVTGMVLSPWDAFYGNPPWLVAFSPAIPKTNVDQFKFSIRYSWSRSGTAE